MTEQDNKIARARMDRAERLPSTVSETSPATVKYFRSHVLYLPAALLLGVRSKHLQEPDHLRVRVRLQVS